jgi:hypothetical protein
MSGTFRSTRRQPLGPPQVARFKDSYGEWVTSGTDGHRVGNQRQITVSFRSRARKGETEQREDLLKPEYSLLNRNPYDNGHEFSTEKWTTRWGSVGGARLKQWNSYDYSHPFPDLGFKHGGVTRYVSSLLDPGLFIATNDVASGKAAIAACAPTKPNASLSVFVGELFSGLPTLAGVALLKERASSARALGSEYLNVQFGWLPLVADLTKMVQSLSKASETIKQFERDSGRNVRRRYNLPDKQFSRQYTGGELEVPSTLSTFAYYDDGATVSQGTPVPLISDSCVVTVTATQRRWFSGMFTYYVPAGNDLLSKITRYEQLANKLLGTRLTPTTLWELAPWSWLIDWFVDIQSHIDVVSLMNRDDLVLRYGYLMVHDRLAIVATGDSSHRPLEGGDVLRTTTYWQSVLERKRRVKSTPYGFGLNPDSDFSGSQWAILGALGLTKAPRTLR